LNSATASIHAAPATTSAAAVSTGCLLSATAVIALAIASVQVRIALSPFSRLRTSVILSAPITAPMPKAPSMMPYICAPPCRRSRTISGISAETEPPMMPVTSVRVSTILIDGELVM
jgi:hypothetical protein